MDIDHCGMMARYLSGLGLDDNQLAGEAFQEVGPGGNFLGATHTMANFKTANYRSEIADTNSFEQWSEDGRKDTERRAYERWNQMLDAYQAPPIDPAIDDALREFIDKKKQSMPDEWY